MRPCWIGLVILIHLVMGACAPRPVVQPQWPYPPAAHAGNQDIRKMPAAEPATARHLWAQADFLLARGDVAAAEPLLLSYLETAPNGPHAPDAFVALGGTAERRGDLSGALSFYRQVMDRYPDATAAAPARLGMMSVLFSMGRYDEVLLSAPDPENPDHVAARDPEEFHLRGDTLRLMGDIPGTAEAYAGALVRADEALRPVLSEKLMAVLGQMPSESILPLLNRFDSDPPRGDLLYGLGRAYRREGDAVNEEVVWKTLADLYPSHEMPETGQAGLEGGPGEGVTAREEVTVGVLMPLSGRLERFGHGALRGVELALGRYLEKNPSARIALMVQDSGSDPQQAGKGVETLVSGGAVAVIGPLYEADAAARTAQERRIPIVTLTQKEGVPEIGDCVFRNFLTPAQQVEAVADHAFRHLGMRRFAVLYPTDKYGRTFLKLFEERVQQMGGEVVSRAGYSADTTDFSTPIRQLAAASAQFEALFIPDVTAKLGMILPQLDYHDVRNVALLGTNLWHDERLIAMAGKYLGQAVIPDAYFADSRDPGVMAFIDAFTEAYGQKPGFVEAVAHDSATMIFETIGRGISDAGSVCEALRRMAPFWGITGRTDFDANGEARKSFVLLRVEGGRFVEIESPHPAP